MESDSPNAALPIKWWDSQNYRSSIGKFSTLFFHHKGIADRELAQRLPGVICSYQRALIYTEFR
jgi:hypothetical protein